MKERNIAVCIILFLVTCGIYGIVWFIGLTDDAGRANEDADLSGGKSFLFSLITCGIYQHYWNYKMGQEIYQAKVKRGMMASDNSVMYLILGFLGLGLVNYGLMQNELNELARA